MLPLFDTQPPEGPALAPALVQALARGAVVLTANLRAARALQRSFVDRQPTHTLAWATPHLYDWNSWVSHLYDQYARRSPQAAITLTPLQEQQLWRQVQGADRERVVSPDRMADLAQQAYALLSGYTAHPLRPAAGPFRDDHEDTERFLAWSAAFDRLCQQHGWLSATRLEEALAGAAHLLEPLPEICLVGFDRTTPAQAALLQALQAQGTRILHHAPPASSTQPTLVQAIDSRQELEACAWWCRERLSAGQPCRIGIIVPDLARTRGSVDRVFRRILMPQTTLWAAGAAPGELPGTPPPPDPPLPYEFSLGSPFATFPGIAAALLILNWLQAPLASAELTWLLTSGSLASPAASPAASFPASIPASIPDQQALARLDAELRRHGAGPRISIASLLDRRLGRDTPAELRRRLERLHARAKRERLSEPEDTALPQRRSYAYWAELASSLLTDSGWPGIQSSDSLAWQAQQRWTRMLGELAQLGFDGAQPTWSEFLQVLGTHAHATIFAAESHSAPIQIMGPFESSGQSFDALWFLGADDQQWPSIGRPHPLLPAWLQRQAAMPHASPEADWQLAQEATHRILASAPSVVLSYAAQRQGVAQRPTPLVPPSAGPSWTPASMLLPDPTASHPAPSADLAPIPLQQLPDDSGVLAWPAEQVAGGSEILRRQAACAFQSFATRRLQAVPLEDAETGLSPRDRGILLHSVLERLWSVQPDESLRLHTRDDLDRATRDGSLDACLSHHIDAALAHLLATRPVEQAADPWHASYLAIERDRLRERILAWLASEQGRQPFSVVALEREVDNLQVGALPLKVRIDRIDQLADGTHLLLDYKTGDVAISAWDGDRPEEPQLPLYALFGGVPGVSGVAFAQIRASETRLLARAEEPGDQVSAALHSNAARSCLDDGIRASWRDALLRLADQFMRGDAAVNPRDGASTCKWCPLAGLCRVRESGLLADDDDEVPADA